MATALERSAVVAWGRRVKAPSISYRRQLAMFIACLVVVDALAVIGSLGLAYILRLSSGLIAYHSDYAPGLYRVFMLVSVPMWVAIFAVVGLYRPDKLLGGVEEYVGALHGCAAGVLSIIVMSFFLGDQILLSRGWLLLAGGLATFFVITGRFASRRVAYSLQRRGFLTARILIVGADEQGIAMAKQWNGALRWGTQVVGFLDDFKPIGTPVVDGLEVIARPTHLDVVAERAHIQEVVIVSGAVGWESFQEILARPLRRNGYIVRVSPGFYGTLGTGLTVTNKGFVPLLTVSETRLTGMEKALKYSVDYTVAFLASLAAAPLMAVIAVGLKLAAFGQPVFDRHSIAGLSKKPFDMLRFRARPGVGGIEYALLATGFDKLPQLFNVFAGQMSLVGPRPQRVPAGEGKGAVTEASEGQNLHTVKPGIIGPWTTDAFWLSGDERQDELHYVRNWTLWLDLQLMLQTFARWLTSGPLRSYVEK